MTLVRIRCFVSSLHASRPSRVHGTLTVETAPNLSAIFYLISGILFILALRGLSSPDTSRQGNYFGITGMIIAILVTFLSIGNFSNSFACLLYTSPSPRDGLLSRMPSSA